MNMIIVYASKTGVTEDVAMEMAKKLGEDCALYDCRNQLLTHDQHGVQPNFSDLTDYDLVILGTAMYMGRPIKEMTRFLAEHEAALSMVPLAFFTCGMGTAREDSGYLLKTLPASLREKNPAYFHMGGEIRENRLNPLERLAMRLAMKTVKNAPQVDHDAISTASETLITIAKAKREASACNA